MKELMGMTRSEYVVISLIGAGSLIAGGHSVGWGIDAISSPPSLEVAEDDYQLANDDLLAANEAFDENAEAGYAGLSATVGEACLTLAGPYRQGEVLGDKEEDVVVSDILQSQDSACGSNAIEVRTSVVAIRSYDKDWENVFTEVESARTLVDERANSLDYVRDMNKEDEDFTGSKVARNIGIVLAATFGLRRVYRWRKESVPHIGTKNSGYHDF